jgi:hypothetical protein
MKIRSILFGLVLWLGATISTAESSDILELYPDHINVYDYGTPTDSGIVAGWMTLRYLHNGDDSHLGVNPFQSLTDYSRSIQTLGPYTETTLAQTLNRFRSTAAYNYSVIRTSSVEQLASEIGYWLNRSEFDAAPYPLNIPVLVPLNGVYNHWAVVTGAIAEEDPFVNPGTTMDGLWIDDPLFYVDPNDPVDPRIFYWATSGEEPALADQVQPMTAGPYAGQYIALVHMPEQAVPEPTSVALLLAGAVGVGVCALRRRRSPRNQSATASFPSAD